MQEQHARTWIAIFLNTYINNAVVEKNPQETRRISTVLLDCSDYSRFYYALRFRAPVTRVEAVHQLSFDQTRRRQYHQRRYHQQQDDMRSSQHLPHDDDLPH
jgi:hypothetical protein